MTSEEGLKLKLGDRVWTIEPFECLWMPYRISTEPYLPWDPDPSVFVRITPEDAYQAGLRQRTDERMNVAFLSREHPRGWQFIKPGEGK